MSFKPDEKDWIAYLYGELEGAEKRKFDQYLLENPEAALELERLRNVRAMLSHVEDKEVIAPPIVLGPTSQGLHRQLWNTPYVRAIVGLAACLIVVILVGRFTGAQLQIGSKEVRLSFGPLPQETPVVNNDALTETQVMEMIQASLERNNEHIQTKLDETSLKLDTSIRSNLALSSGKIDQLVRQVSTASQEQIRGYVDGIRAENMQQVKDYFQLNTTEQKKYIENLLVDFAKYLQQQRNDDLRLVQMRMNSLEQNTDLFKQETEQILSSIITTVGVPVSGETIN